MIITLNGHRGMESEVKITFGINEIKWKVQNNLGK